MPLTEEQFAEILDEVIDETLDLKKQDRVRFNNALLERLGEEDVFPEEDEDEGLTEEQIDAEEE
jgi:hypothetical protein